ncbi:zinc finger, CCHC-type containing protein [Tanacetum coccineum]
MAAAAMKHMALNFAKLDKFKGVDFRRWQKKMYFLLSSMSMVYVLTTSMPEDGGDDATMEQIRKRAKWDNDDYVCRDLILNVMYDSLFDIYHNIESSKELWDSLEAKYMAKDALNFKRTFKYNKEELTLVELGYHLRIEESLRAQDCDKPRDNNVFGPQEIVRLPDPKLKTLGERSIECIFVGYAEHSKGFRFYVIEPNESILINSIIESRDAIFDENRFSSVSRPSLRIPNGTEDIGGSVVLEEVTEEVVTQQPEPELRKGKRNRTPKDFEPEFQLYLIERTRDEVSDQHSYCFNVEDDPKTFDEAIKSQNVVNLLVANESSKKLKVDGTIEKFKARLVMTSIHNLIIHQMDVKTTFLNGDLDEEQAPKQWHQNFDEVVLANGYLLNQADKYVDLTKEFFLTKFSMKDMGEADVILGIRIKHESNGIAISQSHYIEKILKKFNYFDCTPVSTLMDTSEKLVQGLTLHLLWCYTDASWISNTEDNSSTSGWVFLLATAGKEAEWLKNLLIEIPLWSKPIVPISMRCNSVATLAKASSQMYNVKSRHLGVRHNMIRELITNGVISIEFVRSQRNLADHLTKGLAIYLVLKSGEGMGLKSN